jgi:nucleotide-binding universal stress UspA family protein
MASQAVEAISFADEIDAEVTLVAVTEPFRMLAVDSNKYLDEQQWHENAATSDCCAMLARQKVKASDKEVPCKTLVINGGDIVNTAYSLNCDLIAMASHGRRGLSSLLLRSVPAGAIAKSRTPVLVYR